MPEAGYLGKFDPNAIIFALIVFVLVPLILLGADFARYCYFKNKVEGNPEPWVFPDRKTIFRFMVTYGVVAGVSLSLYAFNLEYDSRYFGQLLFSLRWLIVSCTVFFALISFFSKKYISNV